MKTDIIQLPAVSTHDGGMFFDTISRRHSVRYFDKSKKLTLQQLGQLLWASVGVNRAGSKAKALGGNYINRSNPTAVNAQEIDAYVFDDKGVWFYNPQAHRLEPKAEGDQRALLAGVTEFVQDFVYDAPVSIVFVGDTSRFPESGDKARDLVMMDGGIACENLNLTCQAMGLATVPRATMDSEGIVKLLGLSSSSVPVLNNPVGYEV